MKVLTLDELDAAAEDWRCEGAAIVLAAGCFDPLHAGHIKHFHAAKEFGNVLVVAVASDRIMRLYKDKPGMRRPFMPDTQRAYIVSELRCVDAVVINDAACEVIDTLCPHVYVKGIEYKNNLTPDLIKEMKLLEEIGSRLEFVSGDVICSSTALLSGTADPV